MPKRTGCDVSFPVWVRMFAQAVDVMGIVQEVQALGEITIKKGADAGKQKNKRNVSLADKSGRLVVLTL